MVSMGAGLYRRGGAGVCGGKCCATPGFGGWSLVQHRRFGGGILYNINLLGGECCTTRRFWEGNVVQHWGAVAGCITQGLSESPTAACGHISSCEKAAIWGPLYVLG